MFINLINLKWNLESAEYGACSFKLNGKTIQFRVSKITPTKTGQFVTIWKRNKEGITEPFDNADNFAQWMLESYDLNGETVMVAPAAGFYSTPNVGLNEVRIAYVLKKEDLVRSVEILKDAIQVYNAK